MTCPKCNDHMATIKFKSKKFPSYTRCKDMKGCGYIEAIQTTENQHE